MATYERTNADIGAAALMAGGAAAQTAATLQAGTTLLTGLGKVATTAGDMIDKGSSSPAGTVPTGADAAKASAAATRLPTGTDQGVGQRSSF
jgi:hypothetical protein